MNDYLLEIFCASEREEEMVGRLFLTRCTGSTTDDLPPSSRASARDLDGGAARHPAHQVPRYARDDEGIVITAYFDSAAARDEAAALFGDVEVRAGERERQDWLELYQQLLRPIFIGDSFIVAPDPALIPRDTRRHALVIPQEQAFGTGSHETTSLCIELLERLDLAGARGLDVGAGSGILALAMLRLGAAKAIAFDNDVDACGALRDNRMRNGVEPSRMPLFIGGIEALRCGTGSHPVRFDVITMNILPEVILPLLREVVQHVAGTLILSGVLTTRADEVVAACAARGLQPAQQREKGEWWAGAFTLSQP